MVERIADKTLSVSPPDTAILTTDYSRREKMTQVRFRYNCTPRENDELSERIKKFDLVLAVTKLCRILCLTRFLSSF